MLALLSVPDARAEPGREGFAPPGVGLEDRRGAVVPLEATFEDLSHVRVRLGAVLGRGRPALLVLAYNRCAMLCNLVLRGVSDGLRGLELQPGRDFDLVTISIDPRDRAAELSRVRQAALARAGYENQVERWQFLTGRASEIARVAESVGFVYRWDERTEQFAHPAVVIVLSGTGEVRHYLQGLSWSRAELLGALRDARSAPPRAASSGLQALMQCFRPDTASSRYGSAVQVALRSGSALALGGLLLVIARARRARTMKP
jgi:protein SCO1/2